MWTPVLSAVTCLCLAGWTRSAPVTDQFDAMMYLHKFGYMNETKANSASLVSHSAVEQAIRDFQRFAGLNQTGSLDNATVTMMNMPRCGVRDRVGHGDSARRKRYALQGSKWRINELTYRIGKYPTRLKDRNQVDKEVGRAFQVWSTVSPLKFSQKKSGRVHIDIRFETGEHGDGDSFDGPGKTLAHAFFPQYGGDVHFDDEEKWTINTFSGTNLFQVAAHEFGHSLGLSHSDVRSALMAPFYRGYDPSFRLDEDDTLAIQALYGHKTDDTATPTSTSRPNQSTPRPPPDTGDAPDLCQDSAIDAVTRVADGQTFVFKGDWYWEVEANGIADGYPRKISDDWDGLPGNLDSALTWADGKTFFFKGSKYWRYHNKKADSGYPKEIRVGFEGVPNSIDAAMIWSGNGKTYFFKGDKYWRFDSRSEPPISDRYPRPISNWEGIPDNLDAAFQWNNGRTYFFKGRNYYRFNDRTFAVDSGNPPYPRSTSVWWFDCRAMSGKQPQRGGLSSNDEDPMSVDLDTAGSSLSFETVNAPDNMDGGPDGTDDLAVAVHQCDPDPGTVDIPRHSAIMEATDGASPSSTVALALLLLPYLMVFL